MNKKLGVITSGGGLKCSFGAGVMIALAEKFGIQEPDILISSSGSAGASSYYLAKQYDSIRNIFCNLAASKKFVNPHRFWRVIDIDYLIDEIFKKQEPLDCNAIDSSRTNYLIPALNRQTGHIDYLSNREGIDIFEAMRATKAMPLAFRLNPHIMINGYPYCDSCLSSTSETHIEKAVELGAKKILIINSSVEGDSRNLEHKLFNLWMAVYNFPLKEEYAKSQRRALSYTGFDTEKLFTITPKKPLSVKTLCNDRGLLRESLQQGYNETYSNSELASFLQF